MKFAVVLVGCLSAVMLLSCDSSPGEPRLQGTWRSNNPETVAEWKRSGVIRSNIIDQFEKSVLVKLTVTFKGRTVSSAMDNWNETAKYRVLESSTNCVVYEAFSKVYDRNLKYTVRFVEDGYWISNDEILKGYTEKFDRVRP